MQPMWPTTSEKRYVNLKYADHIAIMTGKEGEAICLDQIETIANLLTVLDDSYPGIRALFIPPDDIFNIRTTIFLNRKGQGRSIINEHERLEDGDTLLLL
jgi:hypothetical protein